MATTLLASREMKRVWVRRCASRELSRRRGGGRRGGASEVCRVGERNAVEEGKEENPVAFESTRRCPPPRFRSTSGGRRSSLEGSKYRCRRESGPKPASSAVSNVVPLFLPSFFPLPCSPGAPVSPTPSTVSAASPDRSVDAHSSLRLCKSSPLPSSSPSSQLSNTAHALSTIQSTCPSSLARSHSPVDVGPLFRVASAFSRPPSLRFSAQSEAVRVVRVQCQHWTVQDSEGN